jgi:hypothetical protein
MKRKRALSVTDVLNYNPRVMEFNERWEASFGRPEMSGCWIVWGDSGNGKTRFALQLCKYLARFGRVAYDSLEEGLSLSFKKAMENEGMADVSRRFILLDKEPVTVPEYTSEKFKREVIDYLNGFVTDGYSSGIMAQAVKLIQHSKRKKKDEITCLVDRLERRKSPDIIVIDSLQYSGLTRDTAKNLTKWFPGKLFIFISHADGQNPAGKTAKAVRFDANLKLRVVGYRIPSPVSRFKDGKSDPFVIWKEGSLEYGKSNN